MSIQTQKANLKLAISQFKTAFIKMRGKELLRILTNFKQLVKFVNLKKRILKL